jgi:uncharacterized protein (TIGR03083 family)
VGTPGKKARPCGVAHDMTELADRTILALRARHDELEALGRKLTAEELAAPSGASEWSVAQVFSHLGSAAEIMLSTFSEALGIAVEKQENQAVWDRWNAASASDQVAWFIEHDERLVAALEGVGPDARRTATVDLGFLPEPVPLAVPLGMRLNEVAAHGWDIRVAGDPEAGIDHDSAALLAGHFADGLGFLLAFAGKADRLEQPAVVAVGDYAIEIGESVGFVPVASVEPTATFTGRLEAALRLLSGRLAPAYTPVDVAVTGNLTLDDLRQVFPGY